MLHEFDDSSWRGGLGGEGLALESYGATPASTSHIAQAFSNLTIPIGNQQILNMEHLLIRFATRSTHALALNGMYLGVYPIAFTDADRDAFFDLFGVDRRAFEQLIVRIPTIDSEYKVASNAFNLLAFWVIHLSHHLIHNKRVGGEFRKNVALYLHYRFFTSLVNNFFRHGAKEGVMAATINNLSQKYDIVRYGTWRAALEARAEDLVSDESIHYRTFVNADDDEKIQYVLTDTQTRLRGKIRNIAGEYYAAHKRGESIDTRAAVQEIDGDKVLSQSVSSFDAAVSALIAEVMNRNLFIDKMLVTNIARQFSSISTSMLTTALTQLSQLATAQLATHELEVKTIIRTDMGPVEVAVGVRALITMLVHTSLRYCVVNKIPLTNKLAVYYRLKNVYSASRTSDASINQAKLSVAYFVDGISRTVRESTKSSLRLALIMYVVFRALRHIK